MFAPSTRPTARPPSPAPTAAQPDSGSGGPTSAAPDLRTLPLEEKIAANAHELWQNYGRPAGRDLDIWLEAERQVLGPDPEISLVGGASPTGALRQSAPSASTTTHGGATPGGATAGSSAGTHSARAPRRR
jgi:hypothetical protein